ncbi:MAG: hypothetical protein ACKVS8_08305 [Phycisphaerales bacterium]
MALLATLCLGTPLLAQDAAPAKPASTTVLAIERLELDRVLLAAKDKALRDALHMLPARLSELPAEMAEAGNDDEPPPRELLELLPRLAGSAVRVGVTYDPAKPSGGFAGVGVVLSFESADEAGAGKTNALVASLLQNAPEAPEQKPSKAFAGMTEIFGPPGRVRFGPRQVGGKWAFEVHVGTVTDPDAAIKTVEPVSAKGVGAFLRGRFDAAALTPLIGMVQVIAAANPAAAAAISKMTEAGFIGPDSAKAEFVLGHEGERTVGTFTFRDLGPRGEKAGVSTTVLTDADLAVIPADCYWAGLGTANMKYARGEIDAVLASVPQASEFLRTFREQTGVDLVDDLFASMGSTYGLYMADALGGPNLGGIVAVMSLSDEGAFTRAMGKLGTFANRHLNEGEPKGHVSVRSWGDGSTKGRYTSLRFPGLPVPFEVTYAVAGKWLVMGGTPQAAVAAVRHMEQGAKGLKDHAAVAAMMGRGKGCTSINIIDSSKTIRHGYPIVSMIGSAVGNLVRSRGAVDPGQDLPREPGLIVPAYADLVKDALPMVQGTYWDGADLVTRWEGDKSLLVNMAGTIGAAAPIMPFIPAIATAIALKAHEADGDHDHDHDHAEEDENGEPMEGAPKPNFSIVPR